jgi:hypothetical protein
VERVATTTDVPAQAGDTDAHTRVAHLFVAVSSVDSARLGKAVPLETSSLQVTGRNPAPYRPLRLQATTCEVPNAALRS